MLINTPHFQISNLKQQKVDQPKKLYPKFNRESEMFKRILSFHKFNPSKLKLQTEEKSEILLISIINDSKIFSCNIFFLIKHNFIFVL